ncbi:MAG: T9SS type A sorting domain-containing protein, partial [Bacteroidota bacterium]
HPGLLRTHILWLIELEIHNAYPTGTNQWWNIFNDPNGANIGTPHAYYGLRMIQDIVDFQLNKPENVSPQKTRMKVVLVGGSEGIQPHTEQELQSGTGPFIQNSLHPKLREENYRIVRQSLEFFFTYVTAITGGQMEIELEVLELPDLSLSVNVTNTQPYFATGSIQPVWETLSQEVKESTDWWWIMYPSHVPDFPTFDDEAFITGGMGLDEKGGPAFIIDDKWIVRKPAHLGKGDYSDIERRIYLPQWFQHEFFHHLYRAYPELRLEVNGHDWFNRNFWASDFVGQFEADYYAETLHKRLQVDCVPLVNKLITRVDAGPEKPFASISIDDLLGEYSLDNIQNPWQEGALIQEGNKYFWRNKANVQWEVFPNIEAGRLETGADTPYPGQDFFLELYQNLDGSYIPGVTSLRYQGELYKKRFNILRSSLPLEIFLGNFNRLPASTDAHSGSISKERGQYYWLNQAGERWSLDPNTNDESFGLQEDSPTPDQKFELLLVEDGCGARALGFTYLGEYYWRQKKNNQNQSPRLVNELRDLELEGDFGSYSIDLSPVFSDPEADPLVFFAASVDSDLINTSINGTQLVLSGGLVGSTTIQVAAIDDNGGVVMDAFEVVVSLVTSNEDFGALGQDISIFPNPSGDYIQIKGALSGYEISICSLDKTFQKDLPSNAQELLIDLKPLAAGVYLILISDPDRKRTLVRKVVRY